MSEPFSEPVVDAIRSGGPEGIVVMAATRLRKAAARSRRVIHVSEVEAVHHSFLGLRADWEALELLASRAGVTVEYTGTRFRDWAGSPEPPKPRQARPVVPRAVMEGERQATVPAPDPKDGESLPVRQADHARRDRVPFRKRVVKGVVPPRIRREMRRLGRRSEG